MSEAEHSADIHETMEARFSEYYERTLSEDERAEVAAHLEGCEACRAAYAELEEAVRALSGLHKMSAPQSFEENVEETIRRRSAGRFFGRKAFGDRVPFEVLAILALLVAVIVFALVWSSGSGSLRLDREPDEPEMHPEAPGAVPTPDEVAP